MNAAYVGHIERGVQNPTLNTLERICKGLDISVEDLFIDMRFTDVQRSVRLNKKKKSTNTSPYPDEVIDRLARAFYPAILACWNSEEGQRSRPLHLLLQTALPLKSPTGAFIAALRFANASLPMAGGTGSSCKQRKTGSSHWGTPCCTYRYRLWLLAGCVLFRGAPCFCFALNLLTRDFLPRFAGIPLVRRSESVLHTPAGHCR